MLALAGLQTTAALLEQSTQSKATEVASIVQLTAAHSAMQDLLQQLRAQDQSAGLRRKAAAGWREVEEVPARQHEKRHT